MAQNEVTFTLRITDNNTLQLVTRDAKKAAGGLRDVGDATDRAAGATDRYHRGQKGVIGAAANSTKNFSKMRDVIGGGGSSGLVGAYATLAANVFALTAFLGALNKAAKVEQLRATLEYMGARSGKDLLGVADSLRKITDNAISAGDAMKAASLGTSAGFDKQQLETLAKVAKGASAALGRDLTESYDRLIRGAAKLEPEILDELGIIVRIRDATEKYANSLNKTSEELTTYERQQAFVNAINDQGIKKYGAIAAQVEPTPYEKLAAAVDNLSKTLINLTDTLGISTFINYISESTWALTGVFIAFAGTISKQALPALYAIPQALAAISSPKAEATIKGIGSSIESSVKNFNALGKGARKSLIEVAESLKSGTVSTETFDRATVTLGNHVRNYTSQITGLNNSLRANRQQLAAGNITQQEFLAEETRINQALAIQRQRLADATAATRQLSAARAQAAAATTAQNLSLAISQIGSGSILGTGEGSLIGGFRLLTSTLATTWRTALTGPTVLGILGAAFRTLGATIGAAASLALRALGFIGLLITFAPGIIDWVKSFFPESELEKKQKIIEKLRKTVDEFFTKLQTTKTSFNIDFQEVGLQGAISSLDIFTNTLDELINALIESKNTAIEAFTEMAAKQEGLETARADYFNASSLFGQKQTQAFKTLETFKKKNPGINFEIDPRNLEDSLKKAVAIQNKNKENSVGGVDTTGFFRVVSALREATKAQKDLDTATTLYNETLKKVNEQAQAAAEPASLETAKAAVTQYRAEIIGLLETAQDKTGVDLSAITRQIESQLNSISKEDSSQKIIERLKILRDENRSFLVSLGLVREQSDALQQSLNNLSKKSDTPYTESLTKVNDLLKQQTVLTNQIARARDRKTPNNDEIAALERRKQLVEQVLQEEAQSRGLSNFGNLQSVLSTLDETYRGLDEQKKKFEDYKTALQEVAKTSPEASALILRAEKEYNDKRIEFLEKQKQIPGLKPEAISAIDKEIEGIKTSISLEAEQLKVSSAVTDAYYARFKSQQALNNLKVQNLKLEAQIQNYVTKGSSELTIRQQLDFIEKDKKAKLIALDLETAIGITKLMYEKLTFELTLKRLRAEAKGDPSKLAELTELENQYNSMFNQRLAQETQLSEARRANIEREAALEKVKIAETAKERQNAIWNDPSKISFGTTETSLPTGGLAFNALEIAQNAKQAGEDVRAAAIADIQAKMEAPGTGAEELAALEERLKAIAAGEDPLVNFRAGLAQTKTLMDPFIASMKQLGPEGALIASVAEGGLAIANSWSKAAEAIKGSGTAMEKGAAIAQAAGATLGAISQMMQASSDAKIAKIDQEIAAEQKRDGKSKESLAKIAALEKKKEAEKKKAFETNKKMQMAQTVINTAAAVMAAAPNIPLMVLMGVMGAAQLALIASQSYQGGGASTAAGAPTSIAVGQRTNSIDMAKSQSASGELAYLRGEQGMGGPESFRPAFTGMKYRASGGATTGFMVGEQGPELFIPDRPGTIVPADETSGMGGVTNVTFAISAIDTQGVEDMLENQKGTIINMIRQAANSYGQPFIEQVDTSVYRPAPKSRTYRR